MIFPNISMAFVTTIFMLSIIFQLLSFLSHFFVKLGSELSGVFYTEREQIQGDSLNSPRKGNKLFNVALEKAIRDSGI